MSKKFMPEPDDINTYVNDLNVFYARFDDKNFHAECNEMLNVVNSKNDQKIFITRGDVSLALSSAKPGKACGPDKICGKVVKGCKEPLVTPMLRLFQFSLDNCIVPSMWKTSEIVPIPKNKIPLSKNDLRPVALTSVLMKCLESIVKNIFVNMWNICVMTCNLPTNKIAV